MKFHRSHLAYCTNIHPAESWMETAAVLRNEVLAVRDLLRKQGVLEPAEPFAIGLRLSAAAADELLNCDQLPLLRDWLAETRTYVFTINGFPYGDFHGTRVKERVFQPDWTELARVDYTKQLFRILTRIAPQETPVSVSTLPGSHKQFAADESLIRQNLMDLARWLDALADQTGLDVHLGLEPEPFGHFENTAETIAFFERLFTEASDPDTIRRRIGVNYDACHFAVEFEDARASLDALVTAGIRISKIHLSNAIALDPADPAALKAIHPFCEPTYFHQVLVRNRSGEISRFPDLPDFLNTAHEIADGEEARVHFHIPLDAEPLTPLRSTQSHVRDVLDWHRSHPGACQHFEIETYTWGVLPPELQRPVTDQIAAEYQWVLRQGQ